MDEEIELREMCCFLILNNKENVFPEELMTLRMIYPIRYRNDPYIEAARIVDKASNPYSSVGYSTLNENVFYQEEIARILSGQQGMKFYSAVGSIRSGRDPLSHKIDLQGDVGTAIYNCFRKFKLDLKRSRSI